MEKIYEELTKNYKKRFYKEQKRRFRDYITDEFQKLGYETSTDRFGNVVAGDCANAKTVYSAHYDTPMISPYVTPFAKVFGHAAGSILSSVFLAIAFFAIYLLFGAYVFPILLGLPSADFLAFTTTMGLYLLTMALPNPNNANDNTSGVLAVYNIAKKLAEDGAVVNGGVGGVAFVLFDGEEFGLVGSRRFKTEFVRTVGKNPDFLLCNFDCVGLGDKVLLTYRSPLAAAAADWLKDRLGDVIEKRSSLLLASDNLIFENGLMLTAVSRPLLGSFYLPHIHMPYDKKIDLSLIERISEAAISLS